MKLHCPCCHAKFPLEAALEDGAARDLMGLLTTGGPLPARPLTAYLGLFRPRSGTLGWERALRLARETLALCDAPERLATALSQTVEAIRAKAGEGGVKPLKNHNYLKRVLEDVPAMTPALRIVEPHSGGTTAAPQSKTAQGLEVLEKFKHG